MFRLDHVILAVADLQQAIADYRQMGFTVLPGGTHQNGATANALIVFKDGSYLELLALTGRDPQDNSADFSFLMRYGEGIAGYALHTDDLSAAVAALNTHHIRMKETKIGGRKRDNYIELRWQTVSSQMGFSPFLIQDISPRHLRVPDDAVSTRHQNTITGISGLHLPFYAEMMPLYKALTGETLTAESEFEQVIALDGVQLFIDSRLPAGRFPASTGHIPAKVVFSAENPAAAASLLDEHPGYSMQFSTGKS